MMKPISVLYKYKGGLGARLTHAYTPSRETLAATFSRSNFEALSTRVVLSYPRATFHLYMCGLRRGAVAAAAALIGYNNIKVAVETTTREEAIVIAYFLYTDARLRYIAAPTLLLLLSTSSGNDP
jgi:hypothetical protein